MTDHLRIKHKVQEIPSKIEFNTLLENSMLGEKEKRMMEMYYVQHYDFQFIADELGYTKSGILRMHKRVLKRIEALI